MKLRHVFYCLLLVLLSGSISLYGQDSSATRTDSMITTDSVTSNAPAEQVSKSNTGRRYTEEQPARKGVPKPYHNSAIIFYTILILFLILGIFRVIDSSFYKKLFRSFVNTNNSVRFIKSQIGQNPLLNLMMNLMFFIVAGIFIYYTLTVFGKGIIMYGNHPLITILLIVAGLIIIYLLKFGFLKLMGNLFDIEAFTNDYVFNIFLINKILVIILLPLLSIVVFSQVQFAKIIIIVALVITALAFFNRYMRSQESIVSLIRLNKFHFFIYLCASEILPFAALGKFILDRL